VATTLLIAVISPLRAVSTRPEPQSPQASASLVVPEQKLSFEVATIKPSAPDDRSGKFITMQGAHQFVARNYTVKDMVAAAYTLPSRLISGGPTWINSDRYDILAATPGEVRPNANQQMSMLRTLLADRFNLTLHREPRELPIYELTLARNGAKVKESMPSTEEYLINRMFPNNRVLLPARNVTMAQFASMLQRSVLDRPVLDKTGLSAKYDFDLEWTRDETQFGGQLPVTQVDNPKKPDLFTALQEQLGLKLESSKGPVEILVIENVQKPTEN
jgi:uncharacterized protein (TIGR03435 family)